MLLIKYVWDNVKPNQNKVNKKGNYKSASGHLENSGQLQNNTVNDAMSITTNCMISVKMRLSFRIYKIIRGDY